MSAVDRDAVVVEVLPADAMQVSACRQWLQSRARRASTPRSAYALKHEVESWLRSRGTERYIATEALVVAASLEGFAVRRTERGTFVGIKLLRSARRAA